VAAQTLQRTPAIFPSRTSTLSPVRTATPVSGIRYEVIETIRLYNQGPQKVSRVSLSVVLISTIPPFQSVISASFLPKEQSIQTDPDGNRIAVFEFKDLAPGSRTDVVLKYQVEITPVVPQTGDCRGTIPAGLPIGAEKYLEVDAPQIRDLAERLTKGKATACDKARAIYDYIGDTMTYSGYNPQDVGALKALNDKKGDCTEFSDLFIALNRAAGIPARSIDGITCCTNAKTKNEDIKHNWAEVYLPGSGWVTVDPTWGRFAQERNRYFARHPEGHIVVGYGRNNSMLDGYHFFYFRYWREDENTKMKADEEWSITVLKN